MIKRKNREMWKAALMLSITTQRDAEKIYQEIVYMNSWQYKVKKFFSKALSFLLD